jgi:cysteinyl-tRNA synthetase
VGKNIQLYNTLTREIEPLEFLADGIGMYCCGPTVYNYAHIGNFRTFTVVDLLYRVLRIGGYSPKFVRNITDIDDKTIIGAQNSGETLTQHTERWSKIFHDDCRAMNLAVPTIEPRASAHIAEQITLIEQILERGGAYVRAGSVYFRVSTCKNYGKLSRVGERELLTGDGNTQEKECAGDFVLWKAWKESDGNVWYGSPWGKGRPGWHIECSAMALKYLGTNFSIHAGGIDLIFPHHENEIAQTETATDSPLAKLWFHVAHLRIGGTKMSKSIGNLYTLIDIRKMGYDTCSLRYALLAGHYRQPLNFTMESMHSAQSALSKLWQHGARLLNLCGDMPKAAKKFVIFASVWDALLDDLHAPKALGLLFTHLQNVVKKEYDKVEALTELAEWLLLEEVFGFQMLQRRCNVARNDIPQEIIGIAEERQKARLSGDFVLADALRCKLLEYGWVVTDEIDSFDIRPK